MSKNSINDVIENFEELEKIPTKNKKKKPKPKKADHKHVYEKLLFKEVVPSSYVQFLSDGKRRFFDLYRICSVCNKEDQIFSYPDYIKEYLDSEYSGGKNFYNYFVVQADFEIVQKIVSRFPEIDVIYLEK